MKSDPRLVREGPSTVDETVKTVTPTLLRFADLKARHIINSWPSVRKYVDDYGFPPGRKISPQTRVWTDEEVAAWLTSRPIAGRKKEGAE